MSALKAAREALAALLEGMTLDTTDTGPDPTVEVQVLPNSPESVPTPCAIIQPAEDYLSTGDEDATFHPGEYVITLEVYLVIDLVDNEAAADDLDQILAQVIERVGPSAWWINSVTQPGPIHTAEWMSHGMRVTVATWITL